MRVLIAAMLFGFSVFSAAASAADFDHDATRFSLEGFHRFVECETCHVQGRFGGTPTACAGCHGPASVIPGGGKNLKHIFTTDACEDCHRSESWQVVLNVDHSQTLGTCENCHNDVMAPGKPANHPTTQANCDSCHTTSLWNIARFDHSGITAACTSCHNGSAATGKHSNHISTNGECDICHSTNAWIPADFDHDLVTGSCSTCHDGTTAEGKDSGHFVTMLECDSCHSTNDWEPAEYTHSGVGYPGEHRQALDCDDCHAGNMETLAWPQPAYQPDCAACHSNDFERDEHKKVDSPTIFYSVSELRDCEGACHRYTDSSFTTIERARNGEHRVRDGEF